MLSCCLKHSRSLHPSMPLWGYAKAVISYCNVSLQFSTGHIPSCWWKTWIEVKGETGKWEVLMQKQRGKFKKKSGENWMKAHTKNNKEEKTELCDRSSPTLNSFWHGSSFLIIHIPVWHVTKHHCTELGLTHILTATYLISYNHILFTPRHTVGLEPPPLCRVMGWQF